MCPLLLQVNMLHATFNVVISPLEYWYVAILEIEIHWLWTMALSPYRFAIFELWIISEWTWRKAKNNLSFFIFLSVGNLEKIGEIAIINGPNIVGRRHSSKSYNHIYKLCGASVYVGRARDCRFVTYILQWCSRFLFFYSNALNSTFPHFLVVEDRFDAYVDCMRPKERACVCARYYKWRVLKCISNDNEKDNMRVTYESVALRMHVKAPHQHKVQEKYEIFSECMSVCACVCSTFIREASLFSVTAANTNIYK